MKHLIAKLFIVLCFVCLVVSMVPCGVGQISDECTVGSDWHIPSSDVLVNVTFSVGEGGLLWVNNTVVSDGSVYVGNNSVLVLAATPTDANYSFSSFNLNGTLVDDDPVNYLVVVHDNSSVATLGVAFSVQVVPTVDPSALTVDDSVGLAVVFGLVAVVVCAGLVLYMRKPEE